MTQRWQNGIVVAADGNRACLYGDGVFETMRLTAGHIAFWSHHWLRLQTGLHRLGFPELSERALMLALAPALVEDQDAVLRVSISRDGLRGYRYSNEANIIIDVQKSSLPTPIWHGQSLKVRWCQTRWAQQPLLAGIKHLNRLEQVLARSEWTDTSIAEGLVCDTQGQVISGTMSALLLRFGQTVLAADITQTGIDSVARRVVLDALPSMGYDLQVQSLSQKDVLMADELLLMNVVQGIGSVASCDGVSFSDARLAQTLFPWWQDRLVSKQ
jgi:4-amino-4-deoxychorismate lyase